MTLVIDKLSKEHFGMINAFQCTETNQELTKYNSKKRRRIMKHSREMEEFLKREALIEQEKGLNTTHLFIDQKANKIVGYVSLCNDSIPLEVEERNTMELTYATAPAIKIARLAVATEYKKQGIGKKLIQFSAFIGKRIREESGLTFLTLDCYEHRVTYYEAIGFVRNRIQSAKISYDSPISMRMGLDMYLEKIANE